RAGEPMSDLDTFLVELTEVHRSCRFPRRLRATADRFVPELLGLLFPHFSTIGEAPDRRVPACVEELRVAFTELCGMVQEAQEVQPELCEHFLEGLPAVRAALLEDAHALHAFDPAADSVDEVIVAYPGFYATAVYRIAHLVLPMGLPLLPRILSEHAH